MLVVVAAPLSWALLPRVKEVLLLLLLLLPAGAARRRGGGRGRRGPMLMGLLLPCPP